MTFKRGRGRKRNEDLEMPSEELLPHEEQKTPIEGMITAVERHPRKANRYQVYINEALAFTVHEDVLVEYRLFRGQSIDAATALAIQAEVKRHAAWSDALAYMGRRPRALREVKLYLKRKGHGESDCEAAVQRLEEQGYANDAQFASQMAEHRMLEQRKGRRWVQQELQQKGVKRDVIQEALTQVTPEEEQEAARQLAERRWQSMSGAPQDKRRKLAAFLMRRGYAASMVNGILRELMANEPADESEEMWEPEEDMSLD